VRHEVVGNFIIRIVEQNIHSDSAALEPSLSFMTPALPAGLPAKYICEQAGDAGSGIGVDIALFLAESR
jgi:hypothetical protein